MSDCPRLLTRCMRVPCCRWHRIGAGTEPVPLQHIHPPVGAGANGGYGYGGYGCRCGSSARPLKPPSPPAAGPIPRAVAQDRLPWKPCTAMRPYVPAYAVMAIGFMCAGLALLCFATPTPGLPGAGLFSGLRKGSGHGACTGLSACALTYNPALRCINWCLLGS
jgi:hypothetical protein